MENTAKIIEPKSKFSWSIRDIALGCNVTPLQAQGFVSFCVATGTMVRSGKQKLKPGKGKPEYMYSFSEDATNGVRSVDENPLWIIAQLFETMDMKLRILTGLEK